MTTYIPLIPLKQSEGRTITLTIDIPTGTPDTNIANNTFTWRLWHVLTGTVLEKTIGNGLTLLNQVAFPGQLNVTILPSETATLTPLTYSQQIYMGSDNVLGRLLGEGYIQISPVHPGVPA